MNIAIRAISQVAPTNIPILLVGESGSGKGFLAQYIHDLSPRRLESFTEAKCGPLADGGLADHFREHTGTLFLREISELDLSHQRDLLYALADPGAEYDKGIAGPRLISSTVANMEDETRSGRFRAELYYRINGLCLRVPPLRERKEDIGPLADFFVSRCAAELQRDRPHLDAEDLRALREYAWPGNIRELETVFRKIVLAGDAKEVIAELEGNRAKAQLAGRIHPPLKVATRAAARGAEREMILAALDRTRWNRKRAAAELKISYKSLLCKLKQIGPEFGKIQ